MTLSPADLRIRADAAAAALPGLVLSAERLASLIAPGSHGLRRGGAGEDFWQYRPASPGDTARSIDWRRSGRSDQQFVRDREAQSAQAVTIWTSAGRGMEFAGTGQTERPSKRDRSRVLALALAMVLLRAGEKVGLAGDTPKAGRKQTDRIAQALALQPSHSDDDDVPPVDLLRPNQRAILFGDFLGDPGPLTDYLARAAALGVRGALLQVLDPDEEVFPFSGAVLFQSPSGQVRHDTRDASGLRKEYLLRLAERRELLTQAARSSGWYFATHDTASAPSSALMWLYQVLEG